MAMKVVTTPTVTFTAISQRAAVMRAAHVLAKGWMAQAYLVGDYQDFLKLAMRLAWDLARGRQPRVPTWAMAMAIPAEAKALVQEGGPVTNHHRFEIAKGENPFAAFRAAFGVNARWGWPTDRLHAPMAEQIATAQVVATCHHQGEKHTFWSY